jgi:hypothetical protein
MVKIEDLAGSIDQNYFVQGLLMASSKNTYGDIWEKCVNCTNCLFAKQCQNLCSILDEQNKNPTCAQVVNILTGEIKPEDIPTYSALNF